MPRKPHDKLQAQIDTKKKNLIIKLVLNKQLRTYGFAYDYLGLDKSNLSDVNSPIENIAIVVEELISKVRAKANEPAPTEIKQKEATNTPSEGTDNRESTALIKQEVPIVLLEPESKFIAKFPDQKATLTTKESAGCEQLAVAKHIFDAFTIGDQLGHLLIAPGGSGKTYIASCLIKNLQEQGIFADCLSPWPCLYITKVSIVNQTKEVIKSEFNLDLGLNVHVINIEQIRGELVGTLIKEHKYIDHGEEVYDFTWNLATVPALIIVDESQGLAREDALQTRIMNRLFDIDMSKLPYKVRVLCMSATPGSRIIEMKFFALSTRKKLTFSYVSNHSKIAEIYISAKENWGNIKKHIINEVNHEVKEDEYNPEVMKNFIKHYEEHITWVKDVEYKYKGHLHFKQIEFENDFLREEYAKAEEEHYKRKAKLENSEMLSESQIQMSILASYTIFAKAAENCKRYYLARWINETWDQGFAPAVGFRFKQTAVGIIKLLLEDYNWKRKDISIIWGGSTETLSAKKKLAKRLNKAGQKAQDFLDELGIDIEEDLGLDISDFQIKTDEQYEWEKAHKLLSQKPEEREEERMRYCRQDSKLALFSYKSGGVGLSLHHQKDYPKARPRRGVFTPDYSEKLGIQALYRLPRLTSISDTHMWYIYYRTSIEKEIMEKFLFKCKSLQEVTKYKEFWNQEDTENEPITETKNVIIEEG